MAASVIMLAIKTKIRFVISVCRAGASPAGWKSGKSDAGLAEGGCPTSRTQWSRDYARDGGAWARILPINSTNDVRPGGPVSSVSRVNEIFGGAKAANFTKGRST